MSKLKIELLSDTAQLDEKINLLLELKISLFQSGINNVFLELFDCTLNDAVNDRNIFICHHASAAGTSESQKLICVFDFNIANFIRKWLAAFRASNNNISLHSNISNCRGN